MYGIELRLFGGFEACGPEGEPLTIAAKKARALLAYLALHLGKPIPRERLSSLIWGDVSLDEQARRSLRQALTVLRRELPEGVLATQRDDVLLRTHANVDVARFERDVGSDTRAVLEQALTLYRGELLEGFAARANGFDAWLERERRRLQTLAADALQRLCEIQRKEGDVAASMASAMRLVATDPIREAAHRLLMELYAETGRASEAVRQFEALRSLLAEKLGTAPDALTTDLLERIRRSSERRYVAPAPPPLTAVDAPELRQCCVLAVAISDMRFDAGLERDLELILARFGGTLTRVAENRAVAVFGFPRAHDNDLERGVRAALAIHGVSRLAGGVSVGIASGPVLVERRGDKPVLHGDVLGRASDLSQLEGVGVAVTGTIARMLGDRLETDAVAGDPDASRVVRHRKAAELPCRTPLVGRRYELSQLTHALELCAETGRGRTFIVRGEAGIGKTRLLRGFCEIAARRGFVVHAQSLVDFGDDGQTRPIAGIVGELLSGADGAALPPLWPSAGDATLAEAEVSLLLEVIREVPANAAGYEPSGRALTLRRRREAACRLLALRSSQQPRVVWVDDIHWADAETLAQLAAWIEVAGGHPALLIVTTRIDGEPDDEAFRRAVRGRPVTTLDLAPLPREEACSLIQAIEAPDEQTLELVLARGGGNPLFIEQLLRWRHPSRVPASIGSLVQARSDQLALEDRTTLQAASVLGQIFTEPALSHLLDVGQVSLRVLLEQSLIHEQGDGYRFAHALVRDAIHDSLPQERRLRLHARAAAYYAGRDAALHAQHLDYAGDPAACSAYLQAAARERRAGHVERALELCLRGRELAERGAERHASALLLGELSIGVGRCEAALEAFAAAESSAPDSSGRAQAHVGRAAALRVLDRSKEALLELTAAERLVNPERDAVLVSRIHYLRGNVLFAQGDPAACLGSQVLALEAARRTGSALAEAQAWSGIGDAHYIAGRLTEARAAFARCQRLARDIGNLDLELTSRGMQYVLALYDLSFRECVAGFHELAESSKAAGVLRAEALMRVTAALCYLMLSDWETAITEGRRGVAVSDTIGAQRFAALGIAYVSLAHAKLGDHPPAVADLGRALSLARSSGISFAGAAVYGALLETAPADRIASVLDEVDGLLRLGCKHTSLITLVQHATFACLKLGDSARALRYADVIDASMSEETHALGTILADLARTLARWRRAPELESTRRDVARLRERLDRAGMRLHVSFVDELVSDGRKPALAG